jgi:HSP20 family protein
MMRHTHIWQPPTDVLETDEAIIVVVEIAGMRGSEFTVTFDKQILSIRGHRADTNERTAYHQMEIDYGDFGCDIQLTAPIDTTGIEAGYSDGFLRVALPKARSKNIPIED